MKSPNVLLRTAAVLLAAAMGGNAAADVVYSAECVEYCTMTQLVAGASIEINGVRFEQFDHPMGPLGTGIAVPDYVLDQIVVEGYETAMGDIVGLRFSKGWFAPPLLSHLGQPGVYQPLLGFEFNYQVNVTQGGPIGAMNAEVLFGEFVSSVAGAVQGGLVSSAVADGLGYPTDSALCTESYLGGCRYGSQALRIEFQQGPSDHIVVSDLVYIMNTAMEGGRPIPGSEGMEIRSFSQWFERTSTEPGTVAEPGSLPLVGLAIAGTLAFRRGRKVATKQ